MYLHATAQGLVHKLPFWSWYWTAREGLLPFIFVIFFMEAFSTIMLNEYECVDRMAYVHILQECGTARALSRAKLVHAHIVENEWNSNQDVLIGNHLIGVYGKCMTPDDALWVFDKMPHKDVISWNTMISAYSQHGHCINALQLFEEMNKQGVKPTSVTFVNTLNACSSSSEGMRVYAFIKHSGFESDLVISNALISMFGKCGSLEMAAKTFSKMRARDVITWTTMVATHMRYGQCVEALRFFKQMVLEGVNPTIMTYATVLNSCSNPTMLVEGRLIHTHLVKTGIVLHEIIGCALLSMYGKCGMLSDAHRVFDDMSKLDVVTWNSIISVYIRHGCSAIALQLLQQMSCYCIKPNSVTFISILDACADLSAFEEGKLVHYFILDIGIESDSVWNALLNMYGSCGSSSDAFHVFDRMQQKDVVSWTSLIQVFVQGSRIDKALHAFQRMQEEGVKPNRVTFLTITKACINSCDLIEGKLVHMLVVDGHLDMDLAICNALITMYGNCGSLVDACKVFTSIPKCDAVSWTAVISAYVQTGFKEEAIDFFQQMLGAGVSPTNVTYISIIDALTSLTALKEGEIVHFLVLESGAECSLVVGNALINFYASCGKLDEASHMFHRMPDTDIVSWSSLITAYAHQGKGEEAFNLLLKLKGAGVKPDDVTFVSLLSACSHAGLIVEGLYFFGLMIVLYEILPSGEHCRCIVDLLSRAGWLDEVEAFINHLPYSPTFVAWMTLLGACRVHNNMEKAKHAAEHVLELNSLNPAGYVILSNIYITAGKQLEADKIWKLMRDSGLKEGFHDIFLEGDAARVYELVVGE